MNFHAFRSQLLPGSLAYHSETSHTGRCEHDYGGTTLTLYGYERVALLKNLPPLPKEELCLAEDAFKALCTDPNEMFATQAGIHYVDCLMFRAKNELMSLYSSDRPAGVHLYEALRLLEKASQHAELPAKKQVNYLKERVDELRQKRGNSSSHISQPDKP